MTALRARSSPTRGPTWWRVLDHPLRARWCAVGWLVATAVFVGFTRMLGGVSIDDAWESLVPGAALAHGNLGCMYPPFVGHPSFSAPLWSGVAAAAFAITGVARNTYPQGVALGSHCSAATNAIEHWVGYASVTHVAEWTAYAAWAAFALGLLAFVRTTSRARTWWEPVTALALAATPPVLQSFTVDYHPEDLLCLGLLFGAVAALRRDRFALAGAVLAAALLSQQFALLAAIPIVLTLAPAAARRLVPALGVSLVTVVGLLAALSHGQVLSSLSTTGDTQYYGVVWIAELDLHTAWSLTLVSRLPPLILVAALSLAARRLAPADTTLPLLIAAGFALRLVFEVNIFGYYFCAVAVALVVADVVAGRVRPLVILWLVAEWLLYNPFAWPRPIQLSQVPFWTNQVVFSVTALALAVAPLGRAAWRERTVRQTTAAPAVSTSS